MHYVLKLVMKNRPLKKDLIAEVTQLIAIAGLPIKDSVNDAF